MSSMKVSMRSAVAARPARANTVVVRAESSRRAVLGGVFAGVALTLSSSANAAPAVTPVDIFDDRKAREKGFDIIYEARELDLPQNVRDGFTQARSSIEDTKKRVKESETRIDDVVAPFVEKKYWTEAREELRRQVGTLRFDLNTLASTKVGKEEKKKAIALNKDFLAKVEDLDFSLRQKNKEAALPKLAAATAALDAALANY